MKRRQQFTELVDDDSPPAARKWADSGGKQGGHDDNYGQDYNGYGQYDEYGQDRGYDQYGQGVDYGKQWIMMSASAHSIHYQSLAIGCCKYKFWKYINAQGVYSISWLSLIKNTKR